MCNSADLIHVCKMHAGPHTQRSGYAMTVHLAIYFLVFSVKPGNIIAKLGLPARLDCQTDEPGSFIRWSYGGDTTTVLQPAECNCITLSNFSLYFNQTTHATAGDYTCLVFGASFGRINGSIAIAGEVVI